jgi:hypothetical protein
MWYPIDAGYPAGSYTMTGKVGVFPDTVWDASGFPFEKLGDDHRPGFIPYLPDKEFPNPFDEIDKGTTHVLIPWESGLTAAYPNPFNPSTVLSYKLQVASQVNLSAYDVAGRQVAELVDGWRNAGMHQVSFDASHLASGLYFYQVEAGNFTAVKKMILIK